MAPFPRIAGFDRQLAVVIGVNNYADPAFPALKGAVPDAARVGNVLRKRHGYDVTYLLGAKATFAALEALFLEDLPARVGPRTQLLIYFAGHGIAHETEHGLDGHVLPIDAAKGGGKWLSMRFVRDQLAALTCHHLLLILDCCFAGVFVHRDIGAEEAPAMSREQYTHYVERRACQLLASSAFDERAVDRLGTVAAPFAKTLAAALARPTDGDTRADPDGDGVITAPDLYGYLRREMRKVPGVGQTPNLWPLEGHEVGEYIFTVAEPVLKDAPSLELTSNPYRGLKHYSCDDADVFMGRDAIVDQLVDRVARSPLTVLLGPAGSGKSSVLHAGLHPALDKARGMRVLGPFRLSSSPLEELGRLNAALRKVPHGDERVCILIDQLDELTREPREWRLIQSLLAILVPGPHVDGLMRELTDVIAADLPNHPAGEILGPAFGMGSVENTVRARTSLVVALRSDVEPYFVSQPGSVGMLLGELWRAGRVVLPPMNREQLRTCIEGPAAERAVFYTAAPPPAARSDGTRALVDVILNEIDGAPDALPLMSVALERMFESFRKRRPRDRTIDWSDYATIDGISGALRQQAERLYERGAAADDPELAPPELASFQATFRRVMLRMVGWRDGTPIRRILTPDSLDWGDAAERERASKVVSLLYKQALVVPGSESPLDVVPVHDALLTRWPRLQQWLGEDRQQLVLHSELQGDAVRWHRRGRSRESLWPSQRLEQLELAEPRSWLGRLARRLWKLGMTPFPLRSLPPHAFTKAERLFIRKSLALGRKRWAMRISVVALALVVGVVAYQWHASAAAKEDQTIRANDLQRLHVAKWFLEHDATNAAAVLREVERPELAPGWSELVQQVLERGVAAARLDLGDRQLEHVVGDRILVLRTGNGEQISVVWNGASLGFTMPGRAEVSPDGARAIAVAEGTPSTLWDLARGTQLASLAPCTQVQFSRDGARALTHGGPKCARPVLWDLRSGARLATLGDHPGSEVVWSLAAERAVTFRRTGGVPTGFQLRNLVDDAWIADLVPGGATDVPSFTPDGARVIAWPTATAPGTIWDARDGRVIGSPLLAGALPQAVSPSGDRAACTDPVRDPEFRVIDLTTGTQSEPVPATDPVFSRDGRAIAARTRLGSAIVIRRDGGELTPIQDPAWATANAHTMVFSTDGELLVTDDGALRIWSTATGRRLATLTRSRLVSGATVGTDRSLITRGNASSASVELWKLDALFAPQGPVVASQDGRRAVVYSWRGRIELRELDRWGIIRSLPSPAGRHRVAISPDGAQLAISSGEGLRIIRADGEGRDDTIRGCNLALGPDDLARFEWLGPRVLVGARDHDGCLVDLEHGVLVGTRIPRLHWFAVSRTQDRALLVHLDGAIELRNLVTGAPLVTFPSGDASAAAFDATGHRIAIYTQHALRLCRASDGGSCKDIPNDTGAITALAFSPNRPRLIARTGTGVYRVFDTDKRAPLADLNAAVCPEGCMAMGRPLEPPMAVDFSSSTAKVAIAELGEVWDLDRGRAELLPCAGTFQVGDPMRFTVDGRRLLAGRCLVDVRDGRVLATFGPGSSSHRPSAQVDRASYQIASQLSIDWLNTLANQHQDARASMYGPIELVRGSSPDGTLLVEGQVELRVWRSGRDTPIMSLPIAEPIAGQVIVSPDRSRIVYEDADGVHDVPLQVTELRARIERATGVCVNEAVRHSFLHGVHR